MSESGAKRTKVTSREEQADLNKKLHNVITFESNRSGALILNLVNHGARLESMDYYPLNYFDISRVEKDNPVESNDRNYVPLELPQMLLRTIPVESLRAFNTLNILKFAIDKNSQLTDDYRVCGVILKC